MKNMNSIKRSDLYGYSVLRGGFFEWRQSLRWQLTLLVDRFGGAAWVIPAQHDHTHAGNHSAGQEENAMSAGPD